MKTKVLAILFIISILFFVSCKGSQANGSMMTPPPTPTALRTATPVPTQTSTAVPVSVADSPVPSGMLLDQPGSGVEILGENWNYTNDRRGKTYACIDYTRQKEPHLFLEECFAFIQPNLTLDSEREKYLSDNYEVLEPNNTFGNAGQISVMAIRLEDNSGRHVKIFELFGIEKYLLRLEMNIATDDTSPLQSIYEEQAADILDYVLQNMLEKSRLIPGPTATP